MSLGPDFDFKERVRESTDVVELVSKYVQLKRAGSKFKGLCPFHADSNPSLTVDPARQTWMCWVCNKGGDVFSFTMEREGISFPEALRMLADDANIQGNVFSSSQSKGNTLAEKQTLYKTVEWAMEQFAAFLKHDSTAEAARFYLDQRGISESTIDQFKVGYSPDARSWLIDKAQIAGISTKDLLACGLIGKWAESNTHYDWFRGRVIFPIFDLQNRPIAFGARVLPEIAERLKREQNRTVGKYINSPETRLFSKSNNLYGLNLASESVRKSRKLTVVEGYTDVVMAVQHGCENVVAALGTALNERHIKLIKRFADQVTLVLDGDEAGQRRTNEVLELFVGADVDLRISVLPEGDDPCDFLIQQGAESFEAFIGEAVDALEHKFNVETNGLDLIRDTHAANQALENILNTIARRSGKLAGSQTGNLREQQMLSRLARKFSLQENDIRLRLNQLRKKNKRRPFQPRGEEEMAPVVKPILVKELDPKEVECLEIILTDFKMLTQTVENISPDQFVMGPCRELYEIMVELDHYAEAPGDVKFQAVLTAIEASNLKTFFVELDQRAQEKASVSRQFELTQRLEVVTAKFSQQLSETSRRQTLAKLEQESGKLSEDQERELLDEIFQKRQNELKGL